MPQLDYIIIFPQIFWFFLILLIFYILILHFFLPKFLYSIKLRKEVILFNSNLILKFSKKNKLDSLNIINILKLNLKEIQNSVYLNNSRLNLFFSKQVRLCPSILDLKLINLVYNNILFCNNQLLNNIKIYPCILNLK